MMQPAKIFALDVGPCSTMIHNKPSMKLEIPNLVKMNEIFAIYDTAAWKFRECVKVGELHTAAEHLRVLARLDAWFSLQRLEV